MTLGLPPPIIGRACNGPAFRLVASFPAVCNEPGVKLVELPIVDSGFLDDGRAEVLEPTPGGGL